MRKIGVITVGRSDYGYCLPILRAIQTDPELELLLFVGGAHLSPQFGMTVREIEQDGFPIAARVEMLSSSDAPEDVARAMGRGTEGFGQAYARSRPDLLLALGDRFEMHAAVAAALPFNIPVAHIGGGELTEGAIDDAFRHSITKLSHLHFVYTEQYARRLERMGEEPWRIVVCGAPALDNPKAMPLLAARELEQRYGFRLDPPALLATFHPVTLELERTEWQVGELLAALAESGMPVIFTAPNADSGNQAIRRRLQEFVAGRKDRWLVENLGTQAYFSLMALAAAMVGNSSSGIIEAASLKLPVVNVGTRQQGRARARNILDVGYARAEVLAGIRRATAPGFRAALRDLENPYGRGDAAPRIVAALKSVELDDRLLRKRFWEGEGERA